VFVTVKFVFTRLLKSFAAIRKDDMLDEIEFAYELELFAITPA
jgi:hypothetical protein